MMHKTFELHILGDDYALALDPKNNYGVCDRVTVQDIVARLQYFLDTIDERLLPNVEKILHGSIEFTMDEQGGFNFVKKSDTYVYLMTDDNTGYTKIGVSSHPRQRERTLQSEKPSIRLFHIAPVVSLDHEKHLHRFFDNKQVRGEWFDLTQQDIEHAKTYLRDCGMRA